MDKDMSGLADNLAQARVAATQLGDESVVVPIAAARLKVAFTQLDNGGAFSEVDEYTGYQPAEERMNRLRKDSREP